jgi:hypothetical protein
MIVSAHVMVLWLIATRVATTEVVDSIINEERDRMIETILGQHQKPRNIDIATWANVCCTLFEHLLESEDNQVNLVQLASETTTPILAILAIVRHLVVQNQIYLMAPDRIGWHVPAQKRAARAALDSGLVKQLRLDIASMPRARLNLLEQDALTDAEDTRPKGFHQQTTEDLSVPTGGAMAPDPHAIPSGAHMA